MLIDSTHKKWFVVTVLLAAASILLYRYADQTTPGGLTGGHPIGLWYGIAGTLLMIYAGLLSAHRRLPVRSWLFPRKSWLRGHIWMGLLSGVLILCHSGFSWGGPIEILLWVVLLSVLGTGILGLASQNILPRMLTARIPCEAPYEQIPHLCGEMRRKADALVDELCGPFDPTPGQSLDNTVAVVQFASNARAQLRDFYEKEVRIFLAFQAPRNSPLFDSMQAEARFTKLKRLAGLSDVTNQLDELAVYCEERRLLAEQERIYFWLHTWLLVHVPLSVALLVLGVVHIFTALYY